MDDDNVTPLQDVSSCEAYKVIKTLVEIENISADQGKDAKLQYENLHSALVAAMANEKALLEQAKQLAKDAQASAEAVVDAQRKAAVFEDVNIEVLREDVEASLAEASLAQERTALLALEQEELQRQRDQLTEHLDSVAEQHSAALEPVIAALQTEVAALNADMEQQLLAASVAQQELDGMLGRLQESEAALAALGQEHKAEQNRLVAISAAPEKARRQADLAVADVKSAQQLLAAADTKLLEVEAAARAAHDKERELQVSYAAALAQLERARIVAEAKERQQEDVAKDVELAGAEREKILADQVDLDMRMQAHLGEWRAHQDQLARLQHDKLLALKSYKAAEVALTEAQELLPSLRIARDLTNKDKGTAETAVTQAAVQVEQLKMEVDIRIAAFLKEEAVGQDKAALFHVMRQEVLLLESELAAEKDEDRQRSRLLADMAAQRDRAARAVATQTNKVSQARSANKLRLRQQDNMQLMLDEVDRRGKDFEKLYDLVRNQRNKFVALIAAAKQASVEMADRIKLLTSEQEILTVEVANKAKLLAKAKSVNAASVSERDALHSELHALGSAFRAKHDKLQEQVEAIEALNTMMHRAEEAMAASSKHYAIAIEARNKTGVMLIDRNDELAVLHEKSHLQEAQVAGGQLELGLRDNEIRVLQLQVAELQRSIHTAKSAMPDLPAIDRDIAALKADLLKAREHAEVLGAKLEDPANSGRARQLGGKIPEKDELVAKLQSLEERLSMKQDALQERSVVLGEVNSLTQQLRGKAATGRAAGRQLAAEANSYQQRLRSVTCKMMATISELSLYQATALKLQASKSELEGMLDSAKARLAAGQPPTDEIALEWAAVVRQEEILQDLRRQKEEVAAVMDGQGNIQHTTAESRPNAYIPEDLGIPKPYGGFAPFKPTQPGATMRHSRRPIQKEVVL
eukprot:gene13164-13294_t